MKIYGTGVYENERADLVGLSYIVHALDRVKNSIEWINSDSSDSCQYLLAEIDMLLTLGKKFPKDINIKLKKSDVDFWKESFDRWYEKNSRKIPSKYQNCIQEDSERLFKELENFGHSLDWL